MPVAFEDTRRDGPPHLAALNLVRHSPISKANSTRSVVIRSAICSPPLCGRPAQPYVLQSDRVLFETSLLDVAEHSEEWLTRAESIGVVRERAVSRPTAVFR